MTLFPAFLKLKDRAVLVVGGGAIATSKVPALLQAGARVTIVSPKLSGELAQAFRNGEIDWLPKPFEPDDLNGKFLVISATSLRDLNESVYREADRRNILCNAVDDNDDCHFYYSSIVRRGDLQIAISTNGKSPALARRLREELEQQFGPEYASWLDWLGSKRELLREQSTDAEATRRQLHDLASRSAFEQFVKDHAGLRRQALQRAQHHGAKVFLVGAGPGDPELLTTKAVHLLQSADVVLHDSLVSAEILALIPPTAERIDVGKRRGIRLLSQEDINSLLVDCAGKHDIVVRLKGGDPLLFGRAAEEIQALRAANIKFEVVPGISAAFGAAAAAGVSLTDRRAASHVLFTTYSRSPEARILPFIGLTSETTVIVYMPGLDYTGVSDWLLESGILAGTPCLIISKASQREQVVCSSTLANLASLAPLPAPALLIVGRVASQASTSASAFSWLLDAGQDGVRGNAVS